ncbi:hypothetical protein O6H91_21G017300 [Diphasiastrum complanatum]|uniref:Uncharacterized protein n=2 Tax=Diphasiastrum complanatum TaxID=34168 RepID=A0ACC2AI97_DIPCM|nr:hypothetical protein O6H91_21G017300 [Diphasiastrum complanatum]
MESSLFYPSLSQPHLHARPRPRPRPHKRVHRSLFFLGCGRPLFPSCRTTRSLKELRPSSGCRAETVDLWQLLGGRGLAGGEQSLRSEQWQTSMQSSSVQKDESCGLGTNATPINLAVGSFEKELQGLTGGFPGGEKGLMQFLRSFPVPNNKDSTQLKTVKTLIPVGKPRAAPPPLLMPGMIVRVSNPDNPYYMYTGILQRVSDGRAGVLFEGGNWDKLVSFKLQDLVRSASGPPMTNPKSAVLQQPRNI